MQAAYEDFGCNSGNVFFLGIDKGSTNSNVIYFDSVFGVDYPEVSGVQGGGNQVHLTYGVQSTPSIVLIRPDHIIVVKQIWPPSFENVTDSISEAGGIFQNCMTSVAEIKPEKHMTLAPNPVKDFAYFTFVLDDLKKIEITIRSVTGQNVFHKEADYYSAGKALIEADLTSLENGFYIVEIVENDQIIQIEKIILTH